MKHFVLSQVVASLECCLCTQRMLLMLSVP